MIKKKQKYYDLKDLEIFAKNISKDFTKGTIIFLKGELGAGKTTLARFLINSLYDLKKIDKPNSIKSPTFPILLTYDLLDFDIFHYDLYRISNNFELNELNIEENIKESVTLIEWPEILLKNKFSYKFYLIELEMVSENKRILKINFKDNINV